MERVAMMFEALERGAEMLTPLKFEYLNEFAHQMADSLSLEVDKMRFMLTVFAAFPLAMVYKHLPTPQLKHAFDIIVGISFAQFVIGAQWIHSFLMSTLSYMVVRFGSLRVAPYAVLALNLSYMSLAHLYRIYVDYMGWSLDFTGPQMVLVIKLTSFAFNYYDGVVDKVIEKASDPTAPRVYASRKLYALKQCPTLLQFYGYVYCFAALLSGPAFEIKEYLAATSNTKFVFKGKVRRPSNTLAVLSKFLVGVVYLGLFVVLSPKYPTSLLVDPAVREHSWLFRFKIMWIVDEILKFKYYMAWKLSEGACVLCGFGFEGFREDGSSRGWNGVSNMDIISFEFATSIRDASRAWNKCTQAWLERYVYLRTKNSLMATYIVSALWHGFYPGYYFFFLSLPLATEVGRLEFKKLRPWFHPENHKAPALHYVYVVITWLYTQFLASYLVMAFILMSWEQTIAGYATLGYAGHVVLVVLFVVLSILPAPKRKRSASAEDKKSN